MSVNLRFYFCESGVGINGCVRKWNNIILLPDLLESDLHQE